MSDQAVAITQATLSDPRVARSRERVQQAAAELLAECGFGGVSIEAVARRSGVAKTTIYRHWPTLGELLVETFAAVMCCDVVAAAVAAGPDPLSTIRAHLSELAVMTRGPNGRLLLSFLAAAADDPAIGALHDRFVEERRRPVVDALGQLADEGRLDERVSAEDVADMLAGPIFTRWLIARQPVAQDFVDAVIDGQLQAWVRQRGRDRAGGRVGRGGRGGG